VAAVDALSAHDRIHGRRPCAGVAATRHAQWSGRSPADVLNCRRDRELIGMHQCGRPGKTVFGLGPLYRGLSVR
jgi:hypothetical protein